MKNTTLTILASTVFLSIMIGVAIYPALPNHIASHWNALGEAQRFMPKFFGIFLIPAILMVLMGLYILIPKIDPLQKNIHAFRKHYDYFWITTFIFAFYLFILMLAWNLHIPFEFTRMLIPALSVLFFIVGLLMPHMKQNWFIGIRTPWTLHDREIWNETHRLSGTLFKLAAVFPLINFFTTQVHLITTVVIPVVIASLFPALYSYFLFARNH